MFHREGRRGVTGQNDSGQNGTDKMVYGQNGIGQNSTDKMVWTKWYNFICCVHINSIEFNIYLPGSSQKSQINDKHIEES